MHKIYISQNTKKKKICTQDFQKFAIRKNKYLGNTIDKKNSTLKVCNVSI